MLIENKIDLVSEEVIKQDEEIKDFVKRNKFVDIFRCSAKEGINVNESMEYIISHMIAKQESIDSSKQNEININDRKSIVLDPMKNHYNAKENKNGCC